MSFVFQDEEIIKKAALWKPYNWRRFPRGRLLVWTTYWMDAQLHGRRSDGWRSTSAFIHIANSLLVMEIAEKFISPVGALMAAGLFLAHSLTSMGSSYVAGRSGALCATAQLGAAALALHGFWVVAIAVLLIGCLFVKEDCVSGIPLLAVVWWLR